MKPSLSLLFPSRFLRPARARIENEQRRLFQRAVCSSRYYRERGIVRLVDLDEFTSRLDDFRNPKPPAASRVKLHSPWQGARRGTVVIRPWFPLERRVRVLDAPSCHSLREAEPAAIAAPVNVLRGIAEAVAEGRLNLPTLRFGVIAWLGLGRELLTEHDRERLWNVLEVPVFSQFRGFEGELLAYECEHGEGMHVIGEAGRFESSDTGELLLTSYLSLRFPVIRLATRLSGWVDERPCPCGRPGPILRGLAAFRGASSRPAPRLALAAVAV